MRTCVIGRHLRGESAHHHAKSDVAAWGVAAAGVEVAGTAAAATAALHVVLLGGAKQRWRGAFGAPKLCYTCAICLSPRAVAEKPSTP